MVYTTNQMRECLNRAHGIRVVLAELADRLGQLLREEKELKTAISQLLKGGGPTVP
jgi:hypothetical protein